MLQKMLVLVLLLVALALAYFYLTKTFAHWKNKGVGFIKPYPIVGSMGPVFTMREHMTLYFLDIYKKYKNEPFTGYFQGSRPALLVRDPDVIKQIIVKDFSHFVDHGFVFDEDIDPLQAKNLFNMQGHKWKEMRAKLTPTFTSGRMKAMFPLVLECASNLEQYIKTLVVSSKDVDVKDLLARYTTDVISSCAFGVKCDSINDPQAHFRVMGRRMLETNLAHGIKVVTIAFAPEIAKRLKFKLIDEDVSEFFRGLVRDVIDLRNKTKETRNDFMQLLIQLKEKGKLTPVEGDKDEDHVESTEFIKLTNDDVTAQAMVFFFAGFETSSSALTFALFELSRRPDLQQRARQEIERVLQQHEGQLTYQALQNMKYLDCILKEALRKYPPLSVLNRECAKNYIIPGTNVTIEKGTLISIPLQALQNDPEHFPDPENFNPERFNEDLQKIPSVYMPFGDGPRQCIGLRFARMQSKLALTVLLRNFEFEPTNKTPSKLTICPRQFLVTTREDVVLKAQLIS